MFWKNTIMAKSCAPNLEPDFVHYFFCMWFFFLEFCKYFDKCARKRYFIPKYILNYTATMIISLVICPSTFSNYWISVSWQIYNNTTTVLLYLFICNGLYRSLCFINMINITTLFISLYFCDLRTGQYKKWNYLIIIFLKLFRYVVVIFTSYELLWFSEKTQGSEGIRK